MTFSGGGLDTEPLYHNGSQGIATGRLMAGRGCRPGRGIGSLVVEVAKKAGG